MAETSNPSLPQGISVDSERGVIRVGNLELDIGALCAMADPNARVLWAFVWNKNKTRVQPMPFREDQILWLQPSDLNYAAEAAAENWES